MAVPTADAMDANPPKAKARTAAEERADQAVTDFAQVPEQLDHLILEAGVGDGARGVRAVPALEPDLAQRLGEPRLEDRLAVADEQAFDAAEADALHLGDEFELAGREIGLADSRCHRRPPVCSPWRTVQPRSGGPGNCGIGQKERG
jgi:hypothetical protein